MSTGQQASSRRIYLWFGGVALLAIGGGILFFTMFNTMINSQLEGIYTPTPPNDGVRIVAPPKPVLDFTMTSHTGEPVSFSDFRGKPVLLFFG